MRSEERALSAAPPLSPQPGRLVANLDFLRLWAGQLASQFGSGISLIATPLLVLALTDSPAQAGIVAAARTAPYLFLGLPAGALIDRWNRRTILLCCETARGLSVLSIVIAWAYGSLTMAQIFAVALVQGVAFGFSNIAQTAALPRLVRREQIAAAQALNTSSLGVAALLGPGLGGVVISLGSTTVEGAVMAFLLDFATAVVSVALLILIRTPFQAARPAQPRRLREDVVEGLRYLWNDRPIRLLAVVNMVHRLCLGSVIILAVVVFGRDTLRADPASVGLIVAAAGAGGLIGSVVTPPMRRRIPVGRHMLVTIVIHGIGIGLVGLAPSVPFAMVGMAVVGIGEAMTSIVQVSYRLATIADQMQGRVNSVYRLGSFAAMTVGTPLAGALVEWTGPRTTLWIMAAYVLVVALGTALSGVRRL